MRRCRNRKNGIQNNKETGAIGCILSRRFLLLFVFPVPDKDTAKKTVDKYKVGVCFLNGTLELAGGAPEMVANAVAIAIKNILGLVCDPVAGLVEIPCIKRNASGVANALCAAELALAGITSAIPADEVILTMKRVGDTMPAALRETAEGGLAMTPTGRRLFKQVFGT